MLSTSQFRFANWECLQLFATGNKKPVREVDRIPSSRTVKCAFSNTHPNHDVRKLT
ncbi:Uncharacterised protein [Shigella flexneri]|nr:Uncharacterised protein [Shigella flexneri]